MMNMFQEKGCLSEEPNWIYVLVEEIADKVNTQKDSNKNIYNGYLKAVYSRPRPLIL